MKKILIVLFSCFALVVITVGHGQADIMVGGYTFGDNAFADNLVSSTGTWNWSPPSSTLEDVLVGSNTNDFAIASGTTQNASVLLEFTDNAVYNGLGDDLAVFAVGISTSVPEYFYATINGITNTYLGADTGYDVLGLDLSVALIDLDDFSISGGGLVNMVRLWPDAIGSDDPQGAGNPDEFTVIAAINSSPVPEPATMLLLGSGLVGLVGLRRKFKKE